MLQNRRHPRALWGVVISAIYMLRAYRAVFMGTINKRWNAFHDMAPRLRWPVILLLGTLMIAGFFPQFFVQFLSPSALPALKPCHPFIWKFQS